MFGKNKVKMRDMLVSDIVEYTAKDFYKSGEKYPIMLSFSTPYPYIWSVGLEHFWEDREAAEVYFQKLWEEENARGNASEIKVYEPYLNLPLEMPYKGWRIHQGADGRIYAHEIPAKLYHQVKVFDSFDDAKDWIDKKTKK